MLKLVCELTWRKFLIPFQTHTQKYPLKYKNFGNSFPAAVKKHGFHRLRSYLKTVSPRGC